MTFQGMFSSVSMLSDTSATQRVHSYITAAISAVWRTCVQTCMLRLPSWPQTICFKACWTQGLAWPSMTALRLAEQDRCWPVQLQHTPSPAHHRQESQKNAQQGWVAPQPIPQYHYVRTCDHSLHYCLACDGSTATVQAGSLLHHSVVPCKLTAPARVPVYCRRIALTACVPFCYDKLMPLCQQLDKDR